MKKIGFVGLGTMGLPMAKNLLKAGYQLTVFNRTEDKAKEAEKAGAVRASSPAEVALQSEVVFTMLTADAAVEEVMLGKDGIIHGAHSGLIVVDSSTISPKTSQKMAAELAKREVEMLDAPVTGSEPQAIEGILTFMAGGKKEAFEACSPLFEAMGQKAFYMGESGAGSYTKLANNTIAAINLLSLTEGITMVAKAGIDPEVFVQVVSGGGARSGQIDQKAPKMLGRDFHPNFKMALMLKDLGLASQLANELQVPTPVLSVVRQMLQIGVASGHAEEDMCAIVQCYEDWAGIEVKK